MSTISDKFFIFIFPYFVRIIDLNLRTKNADFLRFIEQRGIFRSEN